MSPKFHKVLTFKEARLRFEKRYVIGLLQLFHGNMTRAAVAAGKDRKNFYELVRRTGVNQRDYWKKKV